MRNRHLLFICFAILSLSALTATPLGGQRSAYAPHLPAWSSERVPFTPAWGDGRVVVEGFYSRYQLDTRAGRDRLDADGIGGRLLWRLTPPADEATAANASLASRLASRTAVGAFAVYAPERHTGFTTWHVGAEADHQLLATPLFGRIDPIVSLGAGAFHTATRSDAPSLRRGQGWASFAETFVGPLPAVGVVPIDTPVLPVLNATRTRATTSLALSPAVGARLGLFSNIGLRGDVRDVIAFRGGPTHNVELSGGLSLTF
jgi:hypothetical protein